MQNDKVLIPSLFEDNFIARSNSSVLINPVNALTELVANAWDAGATKVDIFIPDKIGDYLIIKDNGVGMTEDEFKNRWMKICYNRLADQGKHVNFPDKRQRNRVAFGKNGIGRHGLLCFGPDYRVIIAKDGRKHTYSVTTREKGYPLAVVDEIVEDCDEVYTKLEVQVLQNRPNVEKMREVISSRFMQDPEFVVSINNVVLPLEDLSNLKDKTLIEIPDSNIKLHGYFIDTTEGTRKSLYHGIAIWQSGRLVGEPSWVINGESIIDGRSAFAKRYTFIFKTSDCADLVKEDWSGMIDCEQTKNVYDEISKYVLACFEKLSFQTASSLKDSLKSDLKKKLKESSPLVQYQVGEALEHIASTKVGIRQEVLETTVEALMKISTSESGQILLAKIATLDAEDIDGLNQILGKWSVKDALMVLNEIDRRLSIIEAISKLSEDKSTDELHILHPLVTEARWLFGPEYESAEYIFNKTIKRAVDELFKGYGVVPMCSNPKKRPDLIVVNEKTSLAFNGVEDYTGETGLSCVTKLLIVELKKGGFEITREEKNQVSGYVEDLLKSNSLQNCKIRAFVVGDKIANNVSSNYSVEDGKGMIYVTDYAHLVDTAGRRMMGLRAKLAERYDEVPGIELYKQSKINFLEIKEGMKKI